jgi:hypothetical protein
MNYSSPADQAWLRYWVGLYGPDSALARFLRDKDTHIKNVLLKQRKKPAIQRPLHKPQPHAVRPAKLRPSPGERTNRRIERDIERVTRLPVSDWAKSIMGDPRINDITLQDILDSVETYFDIFDQLRRMAPAAYTYFSKIGAPVFTNNSAVWSSQIDAITIASPNQLPSFFGCFFGETNEQYRDSALNDKATLYDFHLFEKPKNHATIAPLGSTIFTHATFMFKRNVAFTREERKKLFPGENSNGSFWWYLGVLPDGQVRALPCHMTHYQKLPNGGGVHHSAFHIPPGLHKLIPDKSPHHVVRTYFNMAVAATATALAGVTVTIRQGKRTARLGVPVKSLRTFFADRDPAEEGLRRKAIMHLRLGHDRYMADGRIIPVGEHLSGERHFTWRGYDITVGVPGLHFPSPEGFNQELFIVGDRENPLPADVNPDELAPVEQLITKVQNIIRSPLRVPIRHGEPTSRYAVPTLPHPPGTIR